VRAFFSSMIASRLAYSEETRRRRRQEKNRQQQCPIEPNARSTSQREPAQMDDNEWSNQHRVVRHHSGMRPRRMAKQHRRKCAAAPGCETMTSPAGKPAGETRASTSGGLQQAHRTLCGTMMLREQRSSGCLVH
jgi:hypothetical protein